MASKGKVRLTRANSSAQQPAPVNGSIRKMRKMLIAAYEGEHWLRTTVQAPKPMSMNEEMRWSNGEKLEQKTNSSH